MSDVSVIDPTCPLCPSNGLLLEEIITTSPDAYLIRAHSSPQNFLIVPKDHVESPQDLPDTWWQSLASLLRSVPNLGEHYNVSINIGRYAGQTVDHLHFWVIPRSTQQPATGKGLARLIDDANRPA